MRLGEEFALRFGNLFQRKRLGHQRPYLAALDVAHEVGEHRLVPRRAADQREVLENPFCRRCRNGLYRPFGPFPGFGNDRPSATVPDLHNILRPPPDHPLGCTAQ